MKFVANKKSAALKRKRWLEIGVVVLAVLVVLGIGITITIRRVYYDNLKPVSGSQKSQIIEIPIGSNPHEIALILEKAGLIRKSWVFEWYVRNSDFRDKLQAGTYSIRQSQSVEDIVVALTQGKVATDLVTILPGQRIDQIEKTLIAYGFSENEVQKALNPSNYIGQPALVDKPKGANLEGYLYPESFQITASTKLEDIITLSLDQMQIKLTPELRAGFVKQGLTVHQAVILASIVEQEVSNINDRPIVAQVFLKRFRQGMPLGSDVTAYYGAILDGVKPSVSHQSAYNTRLVIGLPPGPISNVSESSLKAVANPAKTDYLYFVSGDDGITYFSRTNAEHEALINAHCKKLCRQL